MPANVETMFYVREKPWHGLGTEVQEAPTSADALIYAGLDWEVIQKDVYTENGSLISGYKVNLRSTDNEALGIVSDRYKVVQNEDAFQFTDDLLGAGVTYETAGALQGGRKVWMLARMPHRYIIAGDEIAPYLVVMNSHDGSSGSVIDLYFGGNSVLYYDETMPTINPDVVFMGMCLCLKNRHGATNYKRKVVSFAEETGILLDSRNLPVVSLAEELINNDNLNIEKSFDEESYRDSHQKDDKKSPKPTIYRIGDYGEKLSRLSYIINFQNDITQKESDQSTSPTKPNIHQPYRSDVIKSISFNCELYHEFESANTDRRLTHQELLGLATNLVHVESGRKVFLSILGSKSFSKDDGFAVNNCINTISGL